MINNYNNNSSNQNVLHIYIGRLVSLRVNCYTIVNARQCDYHCSQVVTNRKKQKQKQNNIIEIKYKNASTRQSILKLMYYYTHAARGLHAYLDSYWGLHTQGKLISV